MIEDAALWASLPLPALLVDATDHILDVNPAAEGFLLASARVTRGRPLFDCLAIEPAPHDAFERARHNAAPLFVNDVDVGARLRAPVRSDVQIAPIQGRPGVMLVLISPRALAGRMALPKTGRAAAKSAIGMAEMLAHEIKNPLAGISGAAQLLSMNLDPQDTEMTDLIVAETRRIVTLLEQVERFGNRTPPEFRAVNLHDILDRARGSVLVGIGAHMAIEQDYDPSLPPAWGDADQLQQVLLNLLRNAAEAADPRGGTIRLRTFYEHAYRLRRAGGVDGEVTGDDALPLQIEVIDDGPGLPPDIAEDVFDPFVSGRENGTGLGLALSAKIISENGGWITVESAPGRTVFRISLRRAPPSAEG